MREDRFAIPRDLVHADDLDFTADAPIAVYCGLLFFNLFALVYFATRQLFLKDTGRKLAHVEKQLRTGSSISDELTKRLEE